VKLVCKEAAMKPLRKLMAKIEDQDDDDTECNWWEPVDPSTS
jgi:hypothetical protein